MSTTHGNGLTHRPISNGVTGALSLTPRTPGHTDALVIATMFHPSNDPNESIELREMVQVANAYFDRGMIDDAHEMLHDALAAGYSLSDATDLRRKIDEARRGSMERSTASEPAVSPTRPLKAFTAPLPGIDTQPAAVRQAIVDSERDIAAGRLHSAHDASLYALSLAPAYLPIYIRLAELRAAMGDDEGSRELLKTLRLAVDAWGDDSDWLTLSVRVILDAHDVDALSKLARALLDRRGTIDLEPYVSDAITRTLDRQPELALELSRDYARLRPNDERARQLYLRSTVATGNIESIVREVTRDVHPQSSADLILLRCAVAYSESRDAWFAWLEHAVARLRAQPAEIDELPRAIECARALMPPAQHGLATAVVRIAAADYATALDELMPWVGPPTREISDAREMLVAACARAHALRHESPGTSIEALAAAVGQAVVIDVRDFAEASKLFSEPISAEAMMSELVAVARETGQQDMAIVHLQALRDRLPEHLEIRTGLADLQVAAGRVAEGVRELRYVAERYEQSGNIARMVEAMRHISAAVPNNAEMKAKLIDVYVQRGVPDEATRELALLGDLHLRRKRGTAAASAFTRGAEIAATTGDTRRAMDLFDRAIAADPDNVAVRHAAVAFFILTGAVDEATSQLREVVRIATQQQDPDEAVAALHQIIGLSPGDSAAYHRLGEILTSLGEYAQAERVYRRLSAFTPDDPVLTAKQSALAALASSQ